jgi:hypothetical protein
VRKRITHIAPWQTAKTFAIVYFALCLVIIVPLGILASFVPSAPGQNKPAFWVIILMPFLYAALALIFVPLGCWVYNLAAKMTGGIEIRIETCNDDGGT